jgi:hypothetical protein
MGSELGEGVRPVQQGAAGLEVGKPDAGTIRADEPHAVLFGRFIEQGSLQA